MKHFLLPLFFFVFSLSAKSQCDPMTDFGDEPFGVSPDTIVNMAPAQLNVIYLQQIDVKVPENGAFLGTIGAALLIDSASVTAIGNLPPGLSYECADQLDTPCTFPGGSIGCAVLSGVPSQAGTYELDVLLTIYGTSFLGPAAFPFQVEGYRIIVDGPLSASEDSQSLRFDIKPNVPNPANQSTQLKIISPKGGIANITVFDLVGKMVHQRQVMLSGGSNSVIINTTALETGLYVYRIDAGGESLSSRFAVSR